MKPFAQLLRVNPGLLFAVAALTGCAAEMEPAVTSDPVVAATSAPAMPVYTVTIDAAMAPADQEAALAAVEDWNAVAGGCFGLSAVVAPTTGGSLLTVRSVASASDLADCLPANAPSNAYVAGCATADGVRVLAGEANLRHVVAHELGHMFGLEHTDDAAALMAAYSSEAARPVLADGAAACSAMSLNHN